MEDELIPEDVRNFIVDKIDSVAELEGLLLLSREPETDWSVESLAQRLYTTPKQTETVARKLQALGFLALADGETPSFRYRPVSAELAGLVARVADAYSKYLIPVTNLIHSKPQSKVQQFADAFKFRKEDK
jgi:hypothetical protein